MSYEKSPLRHIVPGTPLLILLYSHHGRMLVDLPNDPDKPDHVNTTECLKGRNTALHFLAVIAFLHDDY